MRREIKYPNKRPASLIQGTTSLNRLVYTLGLDNGGDSGAGYWEFRSPCNSKVHSALAFRQGSHLPLLSGLPFQHVLVLFTVFLICYWAVLYGISQFCQAVFGNKGGQLSEFPQRGTHSTSE